MTDDIIALCAQLEGLLAKATPGPWSSHPNRLMVGNQEGPLMSYLYGTRHSPDGLLVSLESERVADHAVVASLRNLASDGGLEALAQAVRELADAKADSIRLTKEKKDLWESINFPGGWKDRAAHARREALEEMRNLAESKRFDRSVFADDTEWADWAQSRCRHAILNATPGSGGQAPSTAGGPEHLAPEATNSETRQGAVPPATTNAAPLADLRYGDLCPECNAASGIDACPKVKGKCPIAVDTLPENYYLPRSAAAAPDGPTAEEISLARNAMLIRPSVAADLARAVLRWHEQKGAGRG